MHIEFWAQKERIIESYLSLSVTAHTLTPFAANKKELYDDQNLDV